MKNFAVILSAFLVMSPLFLVAQNGGDIFADKTQIKVISYNIRMGEADDGANSWQYRSPATIGMLEEQLPDVFGIQEAFGYQVEFITKNVKNYKSKGVGREDGKEKGEFMSIFWNRKSTKLLKWGTFWLSETPDKPSMGWDAACKRTATWALMRDKKSGKRYYFVNTHLDHVGKEARKRGLQLIVDRIDDINPEGYPMVLTGDFNVTPDNPCLEDLDKIMESTRKIARKSDFEGTFNGWGKSDKVIDYIYVSGFSDVPEYRTLKKTYAGKPFISDHYPIMSVLVFY